MTDKITLTPNMSSLVRIKREARGMTQAELGMQVGASRAQIKRIEALEVTAVDRKVMKRLAKKLNAPLLRAGTLLVEKHKKSRAPREGAQGPSKRATALKILKEQGLLDVTLGDLLS